ncbi:DUF2806 domain-containing protein [Sphingomonas sp. R86521]|uniref:DUF2806 domain-containing protein n=1 Tax=Sphingomonas sp. R86521 TaxID=3093860 RepID=UPI0036D3B599
MSKPDDASNLPAPIVAAIAGIPAALVPASVKALDRLIGATVDIPVAWLEYQKAKIVSKTEAFKTIDGAITKTAATKAEANEQFADRALDNLVRKSYRQLDNKEAVSAAMLDDLRDNPVEPDISAEQNKESAVIDDDWLNVFERYAEDASTERMQKLWGRVLAGEVRKPGKYGMRTLRFLSEFSQADALEFSAFCQNSFGGLAPKALIKTDKDISNLLAMEASGLIQGASGMGLQVTLTPDSAGRAFLIEKPLIVMFTGMPETPVKVEIISLTPLGQELVTLLPGRVPREAARLVGMAVKTDQIKAAFLMLVGQNGSATPMEILWQEEVPATPVVHNS